MPDPDSGCSAAGAWLFARYAYAPNKLGYCGPPESATLASAGAGETVDVRAAARRFSGAWHYLEVLAQLTGIDDPLDASVVEAYWLGGGVGDRVGAAEFGAALLARIAPRAGHYWAHLTPDLLTEAAPDHGFHVFAVYPWSRLLTGPVPEHPLHVLDNCRIRWGRVLSRDGDGIVVASRRLEWDGRALRLAEPAEEKVAVAVDGLSFLPDVAEGDRVALHWQWLCDRLSAEQVADLEANTLRRIETTNRRLAA